MRKTLLLIVVTLSSHYICIGQSTCAQTLRLAQSVYDQGRLHELPQLLQACLQNGFSEQEKVNAYKLLTLTYIYLEEPEKADDAMLRLLHTDPYFEINSAVDPAEFVALYRTFRTDPIYRIGFTIGVNNTQPNVTDQIKTNTGESKYESGLGFQAGVIAEIPLKEKLTLNPGILFQQKMFEMTNTINRGLNQETNKAVFNITTAQESQAWISLPVSLQYTLKDVRYLPYLALGVSTDYLLSSNITTETIQDNAGSVQKRTLDITREKLNISAMMSAGAKLRIFGGYLVGEVRYYYGLKKVNSSNTYHQNTSINFNNNIGDSLFKLNSLSLTVGYVQNIFKPKKLLKG